MTVLSDEKEPVATESRAPATEEQVAVAEIEPRKPKRKGTSAKRGKETKPAEERADGGGHFFDLAIEPDTPPKRRRTILLMRNGVEMTESGVKITPEKAREAGKGLIATIVRPYQEAISIEPDPEASEAGKHRISVTATGDHREASPGGRPRTRSAAGGTSASGSCPKEPSVERSGRT